MKQVILLPYPPKELSPNKRLHWAKLARAKKAYKHLCMSECMAQGIKKMKGPLKVTLEFTYPDRASLRDDDNAAGSFKVGRDGIAEWIGVDDSQWETSPSIVAGSKGGVRVTLGEVG